MAQDGSNLMQLIYRYAEAHTAYVMDRLSHADWIKELAAVEQAAAPIIADAQRYRSLQGKIDEQA